MSNLRVYSRHYVFYNEIEDDNIRRIVDDFQVEYGNYNDICLATLLDFLESEQREGDHKTILDFMGNNGLADNYLIDMSVI